MAWHCNPAIRQFISLIIWDRQSGNPGDARRPKTINGDPRVWIACPQALSPFTLSQFFLGLSSHGHTLLARAFSQANARVSLCLETQWLFVDPNSLTWIWIWISVWSRTFLECKIPPDNKPLPRNIAEATPKTTSPSDKCFNEKNGAK